MASINASLDHLCDKVVNVNYVFINEAMANAFCKDLTILSTGNKEDVILKPCVEDKKYCMRQP